MTLFFRTSLLLCAYATTINPTASAIQSKELLKGPTTDFIKDKKTEPSSNIFSVNAGSNTKLSCLMLVQSEDHYLQSLAKDLKYDLEFTDQMALDLKKADHNPSEEVIKKLFGQGFSMAITIKPIGVATANQEGNVEIIVRDTYSNETLFNAQYPYNGAKPYFNSHAIAKELLPAITGEPSPFDGSLAYCKQYSATHKVICMSDITGKKEQVIVPNLTISVAPRWHTQAPVLFYSQFTKSSTRLMSVNVQTCKQRSICAADGLNMQPSFSEDGKQVALCMSGKQGNTEIYLYDKLVSKKKKCRVYRQITHNRGNNTSPCLLPNGDIIFCSDFQTGSPQIYYLDMKKRITRRLSSGKGYCAAPSFNPQTRSIVYTKLINGTYELCTLHIDDKLHREKQISTGPGDKLDPAWSPCGRFVAFTYHKQDEETNKHTAQIGILNCASKSIRVVTRSKQPKSFPTWINKPFYAT